MRLLNTKDRIMILKIDGQVVGRIAGFSVSKSRDLPMIRELGRESCVFPTGRTRYSVDLVSLHVAPELLAAIEAWKEKQK